MKLVRLPTKDGPDWWIIVHDLTLTGGRLRNLRAINVFTHLSKLVVQDKIAPKVAESCLWLENKLFGVRHHYFELKKAIAETDDPFCQAKYVRDYDDQQKVICILEAYLNSIYSALELTAQINRCIYPELRIGFRNQSKKFALFSFDKWKWLLSFFDVRSELEHFASSLPQIEEGNILINVTSEKNKYILKKGKNKIPLAMILNYSIGLFALLDEWAIQKLKKIDPDRLIPSIEETGIDSPLRTEKIKAKEIVNLMGKEMGNHE
jgi:hypothetical protein